MKITWQNQIDRTFELNEAEKLFLDDFCSKKGFSHKSWDDDAPSLVAIKSKIYKTLRRNQRCRCAYCGFLKAFEKFDIEHYLPKRYYPNLMFSPYNLVLACKCCNRDLKFMNNPLPVSSVDGKKARKGLVFGKLKYKFWHPYFHDARKHFEYQGKYNHFIGGLSPEGKETVRIFKLDRPESIFERQLHASGLEALKDKKLKSKKKIISSVLSYRSK